MGGEQDIGAGTVGSGACRRDIDGDGQLELFSAGRGQNCGFCETLLYGWRKDGTVLQGWPKTDQADEIILLDVSGNQNTPALIDELFAPNCVIHTPDGALQGTEGARQLYSAYVSSFPDVHCTIEDIVADDDPE